MLKKQQQTQSGVLTISGTIPIHIHPLFWVIAALISFLNAPSLVIAATVWFPIVFISILIHEYGHALTARAFGQQAQIQLVAFGGLTVRSGKTTKLWQDFLIILNGPLAGGLLVGLSYLYLNMVSAEKQPLLFYAGLVCININIIWTLFNLLPIHPLDGGHLLRCLLQGLLGLNGIKLSLLLSLCFAAILAALFFTSHQLLIGSIFLLFAFESYRAWRSSLKLTVEDEDIHWQEKLAAADKLLEQQNFSAAQASFEHIVAETKQGMIHLEAIEALAQIYFHNKRYDDAYKLLKPHMKQLSIESLDVAQASAYHLGELNEALAIGNKLWREEPMAKTARLNAFCHAAKGEAEQAVGWLSSMAQEDASTLAELVLRPEFDSIRHQPIFHSFSQQFP